MLVSLAMTALAGRAAWPEDPAPVAATTVSFSEVGARLLAHDAPLWLHVRIESDGRIGLRSTVDAPRAAWKPHGIWRFTGAAAEDMLVLRALFLGLHAALGGETPTAEWRDQDRYSRARVVVDAASDAPWRRVQWVVRTGAHHRLGIYRWTFLASDAGTWIDIDERKEGGRRGLSEPSLACVMAVRLSQPSEGEGLEAPFTRLHVRAQLREVYGRGLDAWWEAEEEEWETAPAAPGAGEPNTPTVGRAASPARSVVDLPSRATSSGSHAAAWRRFSAVLDGLDCKVPRIVAVGVILPGATTVPTGDVLEVLLRLRDAGITFIGLEGAPPPLLRAEGGGWDFDR